MSTLKAVALAAILYTVNGADFGCKAYLGLTTGPRPNPIGICLTNYLNTTSIIGGAFAVSSQYVCEQGDDGNYTVKQEFYNSTSCDVDAAYAVTISTDQDYIDCESSGCPVFEYRSYAAIPSGLSGECTKTSAYTEESYLTDICLATDSGSYYFECDDSAYYYWSYSTSDCSGTPNSNTATGIIEEGCDGSFVSTSYYEVQACSGCNVYSVMMVFVMLGVSHML